jgi:probable phosphoglycerate mutase
MIYLIRHGETRWNREGRIQGHLDSPLTARGREQVTANGCFLRNLIPDPTQFRIVTSPLGRCRESASLIARALGRKGDCIEEDSRLKEHGYGAWEGLTHNEIEARDGDLWRRRSEDRWNVRPPGGECYALVARRVRGWLDEIEETDLLVVISHATTGRILRGLYAGMARETILGLDTGQDKIHRLSGGKIRTYVGLSTRTR